MSYPYDTPCEHPDCREHSCGVKIEKREVCIEHIDWAMTLAFEPVRKALAGVALKLGKVIE